ncbi:MAG TPA: hypothetical protein VK841_11960 [Polyangiaceae bacterium]|nr:hypothetical protein [Polyangiaceae bacterium]
MDPSPKTTKPTKEVQTLAPARNFALSLEQRIAAAMNGPPPYAARLRKIELLREAILRDLAKHEEVPSFACMAMNEGTLRASRSPHSD